MSYFVCKPGVSRVSNAETELVYKQNILLLTRNDKLYCFANITSLHTRTPDAESFASQPPSEFSMVAVLNNILGTAVLCDSTHAVK